jgi:hypothetical protein
MTATEQLTYEMTYVQNMGLKLLKNTSKGYFTENFNLLLFVCIAQYQ